METSNFCHCAKVEVMDCESSDSYSAGTDLGIQRFPFELFSVRFSRSPSDVVAGRGIESGVRRLVSRRRRKRRGELMWPNLHNSAGVAALVILVVW